MADIWKDIPFGNLQSSLQYNTHLSRQLNCRSLRCSWSITCRRCSNYIFVLDLTPGFKGLGKDDFKTRWESFKFWDLVRLILEFLRYLSICDAFEMSNQWQMTYKATFLSACISLIAFFICDYISHITLNHQWNRTQLAQIMACSLFGTKSLFELMVVYC